jgi:hypothetical protein
MMMQFYQTVTKVLKRTQQAIHKQEDYKDFSYIYSIQHCFICCPSDSTVSVDAGIETRTVVTYELAVRPVYHSAKAHSNTKPQSHKLTIFLLLLLAHTEQDFFS